MLSFKDLILKNVKRLFVALGALALIILFQNCGNNNFQTRTQENLKLASQAANLSSEFANDNLPEAGGLDDISNGLPNERDPIISGDNPTNSNIATSSTGKVYFVSTSGNDSNVGTSSSKPFKTVAYAVSKMVAGDTTYVRGGLYNEKLITFKKSGTAAAPIKLLNYPGEKPIVDFGVTPSNLVVQRFEIANLVGYITIEGLEIRRGWEGIKYNSSANNITIRRNWIHSNKGQGILGGGINITIDRNIVSHNGWNNQLDHGLYLTGSNYVITNNLIYANATFGIQVAGYTWEGTTNYAPKKGTVPDRRYAGASNFLIANNTIAYNGASGIVLWLPETQNNRIINNIFYENSADPKRTSDGVNGIAFLGSGNGNAINNNLFYATGSGGMRMISSSAEEGVHYTLSGNIVNTFDPKFVNAPAILPSSPNFMLMANSPAINKGLTTSATKLDFRGVARPRGSAFDIGAYEY